MQAALPWAETGWRDQAPPALAGAAAATAMVSIAASQILLGLALLSLFATSTKVRWPRVATPLAAFMAWTLVSLAASGHAREGLPQIKKFYVYLTLVAVYSAVRGVAQIRWIALGWISAAALSAAWGLEQFARKYRAAEANHADFYAAYVSDRITGFMGHWMTFSGEMMMALMVAGALALFAPGRLREKVWIPAAGLLIACGMLAAQTRSTWGGAFLGGLYLLWFGKRWTIAAVPVVLGGLLVANPFGIRERAQSIVEPHGELDSNQHRAVLRRIGWEMIKANPIVGLGPEQVGPQLKRYIPPDVPRPLPNGYYGHLHNIYYHYAAERGIPALLAVLWLFGQALWDFSRGLREAHRESGWVLRGAVASILAVMFAGFFEVNLGDSEVLASFLGIVAVGYVALEESTGKITDPVR